jgi:outer membrane protein TolC
MNILVKSKEKPVILLLFLCSSLFASAQPTDSLLIKAIETGRLLPMLIDSAIKHNPEVNRVDNSVGLAKENLKISKKNIFSAFSLFSSYNYGNNANVITGSVSNVNLVQTSYYNAGVYVQLPLTHIVSRKNTIRASEYQVKMAESEKDGAVQYISQEVIRIYQELRLALKLVSVSIEGKQTALVNYQMCQKQYLQNDVPLTELSRIQDIYTKASIEFETDVNRFQTAYLQLENYTGVKLSNLIASLQ